MRHDPPRATGGASTIALVETFLGMGTVPVCATVVPARFAARLRLLKMRPKAKAIERRASLFFHRLYASAGCYGPSL